MRDVTTELKELRLHGMVGAWTDLVALGTSPWGHRLPSPQSG